MIQPSLTYYIGPMDPPIEVQSNETLNGAHIIIGGSMYGRVLFTEQVGVRITGNNCAVTNCLIEVR